MTARKTGALTRRRLGGAVLLLVGIAVAAIVLWPSGGDDRAETKPLPVRIVSVPPLGLGFAYPRTWKRDIDGTVIRLTSPDGTLVLLFSSPLDSPNQGFAKSEAKSALLERFAPAKVVRDGKSSLGTKQVTSFEIEGARDKKRLVRALVHVDSTRWRTYVITMLTGQNPSAQQVREARKILNTVNFSKPREI